MPDSSPRILVAGEVLWDVFESAEHLGGAPLNFAVHLTRLGGRPLLASAVGNDERGRRAASRIAALGLDTQLLAVTGDFPTGIVSVRVDAAGQPDFTIHRPAAYDAVEFPESQIARFDPDWIYYGTLLSAWRPAAERLKSLIDRTPGARRFYDVNLRRDSYTPELVRALLECANVVKLNEDEVRVVAGICGWPAEPLEAFCRAASEAHGFDSVCVTRGAGGCAILVHGEYAEAAGFRVEVADTVGAGDAFAAAFLHGLGRRWRVEEIGEFANRVGAVVAGRPGGTPEWSLPDLDAVK